MQTKRSESIEGFLREHPGYRKWGKNKLAGLFKCSKNDIIEVFNKLKTIEQYKTYEKRLNDNNKEYKNGDNNGTYRREGMHIILPCVHVPFHNRKFYDGLVDFIKDHSKEIVGVHILGDFLDMNSLSSHDRGRIPIKGVTLGYEYKEGNIALDKLTRHLDGDCIKTYIWGNHEDRHKRYMSDVDHAKLEGAMPSPTEALHLLERGFHTYENWKESYVTLGRYLDLMHGEFIVTNTAKKHIDTYRKSIVFAHTHRVQSWIEGQTGGYNIGSMIDMKSPAFGYATRAMKASWNNGFGIVNIDSDGFYHFQQIMYYNNKFYYNNKQY